MALPLLTGPCDLPSHAAFLSARTAGDHGHRHALSAVGLCTTPPTAPQTLPAAPNLCTCTGWGSSGTDTGAGTGMSSFNHGGFFRCKLLVLSCRTSDIVPRLSSGLGERRHRSWEGARLIPDTAHASRAEQSPLLQAVAEGPTPHTGQLPKLLVRAGQPGAVRGHRAFLRPAGPGARCQRPQSQV